MRTLLLFLLAASQAPAPSVCAGIPINPPLTCTTDANGVQSLSILPSTVTIKTSRTVRNEIPIRSANGVGWTLTHMPIAGVTCWLGISHQKAGVDYVLDKSAPYITAPGWKDGNVACDYEY